ncbi:MAG: metallophosphoesterase [Chloroflexi bacterium]|nr:metallophosphoesterase [Chloroflexota bacterium]
MSNNGLSRRKFLKVSLVSTVGTALMGLGSLAYARDVEPTWIDVVRLPLTLPRLSPAFDGYRLAHISDIHMGTGMTLERLQRIVEMVNAEQPDAVAITGDFVTLNPVAAAASVLVEALRGLRPKDTAAAVLGNHDHWTDPTAIRRVLRQSGILDLSNTVYTLRRGTAVLHLAGVDDYWERQARLDDVLAQLPADGAAILLAHEPDYADISSLTGRFDLQLSGHSHGGQVIIPLYGPLVLPTYGQKYPLGRYQVGTMIQYTNRGLGTVRPAVRFNCRPEITVFTLRAPVAAT